MARKKREACDSESCLEWGREFHKTNPKAGKAITYGAVAAVSIASLALVNTLGTALKR
jgi:hypothetical protein